MYSVDLSRLRENRNIIINLNTFIKSFYQWILCTSKDTIFWYQLSNSVFSEKISFIAYNIIQLLEIINNKIIFKKLF